MDSILTYMHDPAFIQNLPPPSSLIRENDIDEAYTLLSQCLHRSKRTYEKAERAVHIILLHKLTDINLYCRGLVHFPDLLKKYLEAGALISTNDLVSMFCRCIEHDNLGTWAYESIHQLIEYKGDSEIEIKLLPGKYTIDTQLYSIARSHGVHDTHYDNSLSSEYLHQDVVAKELTGLYTGFREAYHILLYAGVNHLQSLIVRWDLWGDDCTADAARQFFNLSENCPIDVVKSHVNRKCKLLSL